MKQFKDPFEAAFEEQDESPPESPIPPNDFPPSSSANPPEAPAAAINPPDDEDNYDDDDEVDAVNAPSTSTQNIPASASVVPVAPKAKENEDDEEEEENMDVELGKLPPGGDPDKMDKMKKILSQFTDEQMNRYESFRRSGFQKATMKRLLVSITGTQKISMPMTIVMSGIAKMFVGELVETARVVMTERKESGPIRPCHIREAYRRVKLEGKVPKRTIPRLFR